MHLWVLLAVTLVKPCAFVMLCQGTVYFCELWEVRVVYIVAKHVVYSLAICSWGVFLLISDCLLFQQVKSEESSKQKDNNYKYHNNLPLSLCLESFVSILPNDVCGFRGLLEANEILIELVLSLHNLPLPVLFALHVAGSFVPFLGLKRNRGSHRPAQFLSLVLFELVDFVINFFQFFEFSLGDQSSSFR